MADETHLLGLVTSYNHIPSIGDDNIVATVDARVVYGLMLAHEHERNALGELSEHALGRVYVVPHPRICQRRLGVVSDSLRMREVLTFPIACDILCQPVLSPDHSVRLHVSRTCHVTVTCVIALVSPVMSRNVH